MNCDSCFISSHSRVRLLASPRSIASIARSIVGRDISRSSSSENHRSPMLATSVVALGAEPSPGSRHICQIGGPPGAG